MIDIPVPFLSQLDNTLHPYGTCNVTSIAMCMTFYGQPARSGLMQLEDKLCAYCLDHGLSRHSPGDLAILARKFGYYNDFDPAAKWGDVKKWLESGKPCIVHGWFTQSGHIIVIRGYNESGWIVNDPYGEWHESGYDTSVSGEGLTYSYEMMARLCGVDGDLWIHYFGGKDPGPYSGLRLQDFCERGLVVIIDNIKNESGIVRQIQQCLSRFPVLNVGNCDGVWGDRTEAAYVTFCENFDQDPELLDPTIAELLIEAIEVQKVV